MGGLKTIATVATVAFVTTGSSLSRANGKEQQKLDGAAFLETFDDGLKGWVKSEVEQYTGASLFFSPSLSSDERCVRAFVLVSKRVVVSRLKEIRARDERERCTRKRQFRSAREKRSHHRLVFGRQKHVLFASSSVHFSHQKRRADDDFVCSFVRPLFSVALACFCLLTNTLSLSLCFSLW